MQAVITKRTGWPVNNEILLETGKVKITLVWCLAGTPLLMDGLTGSLS